jgi:FtsP/CotA-like multicopper oxidase with cupredoxin domain
LPIAAVGEARAAQPTADVWTQGAKPDFVLSIARQEAAPFGTPVQALLVGGTWPGLPIRYRKGDRFRVLVENSLEEPTSLHWHGLVCPNLEDGVPTVTQAPIAPGEALYYEFDLKQAGTFWYHSHFGLQEQQGLAGPLIIEDPNEPHAYDEDLTVMLSDVIDIPVDDIVPRIREGSLEFRQQSLHLARRHTFFDRRALYRLSSQRAHAEQPLEPRPEGWIADTTQADQRLGLKFLSGRHRRPLAHLDRSRRRRDRADRGR